MSRPFFAAAQPPRGVLRISGEDRQGFLQGLVSNDVRQVTAGRGIWSALLTPQGKFLFDFFITALDDALLLEAEGARVVELHRRLAMFRLRSKVKFETLEGSALWHVWGEGSGPAFGLAQPGDVASLATPSGGGLALLDPRLATLGVRVLLPAATGAAFLLERGLAEGEFAAWDRQRLGSGVPDGSRDLEIEKAILLENGFDELNGVAWDKGCYMGQELTARTKYRGLVKKRLLPVAFEGDPPPYGTIIRRGDGSEAGEMRSGLDGQGLALLRLEALASGEALTAEDGRAVDPRKPSWLAVP